MKKPVHLCIEIMEVDAMQVYESIMANPGPGFLSEGQQFPDKKLYEGKSYFEAGIVVIEGQKKGNMRLQTPVCDTESSQRMQFNNLLREINKSIMALWDSSTPKAKVSLILHPNGSRLPPSETAG